MKRSLLFSIAISVSCARPSPETLADLDLELRFVTDTIFVAGDANLTGEPIVSRIASLGFDGRGNLHAFDSDRYRVTTWAPDGTMVRSLGQRGEGPGEFQIPRYAYILREGRVMVYDIGAPALWVFGPKGQYERSVRLSPSEGGPVPGSSSVQAGGRLVGVDDYWMSRHSEGAKQGIALFAYDFTGDSIHSVPFYTAWTTPPSQDELAMLPTVRLAGFADGRVAVADSIGYRIKVISIVGEVVNVIERPIMPLPVTDLAMKAERGRRRDETSEREIQRAVREMTSLLGVSIPRVDARQVVDDYIETLDDLRFSEEIPVIRSLEVDWEERIWVTRSDSTGADGPIDLLEADGRYIGTLFDTRRPDAFGPGGLVAYIDDHELGTHSIVVARISSVAPAVKDSLSTLAGESRT